VKEYTTKYDYEDGYYDREKREFYGFGKVTASNGRVDSGGVYHPSTEDGISETVYYNREYYAKGIEKSQTIYDENRKVRSRTENTLDGAYPRVTTTTTTQYEYAGPYSKSITTKVTYDHYDSYGNATEFTDHGFIEDSSGNSGTGRDKIRARITYWNGAPAEKYLHSHPTKIEVLDSSNKVLRVREGKYDNKGAQIEMSQHYSETGQSLKNT
jgi:hypothetical protein